MCEQHLQPHEKADLLNTIHDLAKECDARHAHEDALEAQVRQLGGQPVQETWLDPVWDGRDIENDIVDYYVPKAEGAE